MSSSLQFLLHILISLSLAKTSGASVLFSVPLAKASDVSVDQNQLEQELLALVKKESFSPAALKQAIQFYFKNKNNLGLSDRFVAVADLSQKSNQKRLAIFDLKMKKAEFYKVSHGKGSDPNHDLTFDQFVSRPGSHGTPPGFHKMTTTYYGQHGLSLKMEGLEKDNQNSLKRAIVLHGADYVSWPHTGRSQGCPAVEKKYTKKIIDQLKGGSLFYFYK